MSTYRHLLTSLIFRKETPVSKALLYEISCSSKYSHILSVPKIHYRVPRNADTSLLKLINNISGRNLMCLPERLSRSKNNVGVAVIYGTTSSICFINPTAITQSLTPPVPFIQLLFAVTECVDRMLFVLPSNLLPTREILFRKPLHCHINLREYLARNTQIFSM
jgi:hypothetical protein